MYKNWLLPVLITNCLFAECLVGQEQAVALPRDPRAAIAALPIMTPVVDGQIITVLDGDTKKPIANADVLAFGDVQSEVFQAQAKELRTAMQARNVDNKEAALYGAAVMGTRYQTNAEGIASIPAGKGIHAVIMAGHRISEWTPRTKGPVELFAPRWVHVKVVDSRGGPARNVEVGLTKDSNYFRALSRQKTDASGICKFNVTDYKDNTRLKVAAMIACQEPVDATFELARIPKAPLQLQLPPCGQVRFILYGEDERPSKNLTRALLNWQWHSTSGSGGRLTSTWPTQLDPDGAMFGYVALGLDIDVAAYLKGVPQALKFKAKGPTREREMIIVDGRINTGLPIISFRVLDQQGQPLASQVFGRVFYSKQSHDYTSVETDKNGMVTIAFSDEVPESIYIIRRNPSEGSEYLGAACLKLKQLKPGKQKLGDLQLLDEPVIASGTVVDAAGKPVAGIWLNSKTTIVSSGSGGGSSEVQRWYYQHRVRTDDKGHFEMREVAPVDNALRITLDGDGWAPLGDAFTLSPGETDAVLRVGVATLIQGKLLGPLDGMDLEVRATNRDTKRVTTGYLRSGKFRFDRLPEGSYDISFGKNGDFTIENVKSAKKGAEQDPRLQSDKWTEHFQVLETTVTDEADKPLENITVFYYVAGDRGRSGNGARTDKQGKTRRLMPLKNASIEVRQPGYEPRVATENLQNLKLKLLPIAAIDVHFIGIPKLTDGVLVRASIAQAVGKRTRTRTEQVKDGEVTLHPSALGKCQLTLTLGIPYRRELANNVRRAVRRALNLQGVTFELTGTRKPTEKKVIKLDQQVIDDIKACLDDVRELLKQDGK